MIAVVVLTCGFQQIWMRHSVKCCGVGWSVMGLYRQGFDTVYAMLDKMPVKVVGTECTSMVISLV
jgi:hypothetical protein